MPQPPLGRRAHSTVTTPGHHDAVSHPPPERYPLAPARCRLVPAQRPGRCCHVAGRAGGPGPGRHLGAGRCPRPAPTGRRCAGPPPPGPGHRRARRCGLPAPHALPRRAAGRGAARAGPGPQRHIGGRSHRWLCRAVARRPGAGAVARPAPALAGHRARQRPLACAAGQGHQRWAVLHRLAAERRRAQRAVALCRGAVERARPPPTSAGRRLPWPRRCLRATACAGASRCLWCSAWSATA